MMLVFKAYITVSNAICLSELMQFAHSSEIIDCTVNVLSVYQVSGHIQHIRPSITKQMVDI